MNDLKKQERLLDLLTQREVSRLDKEEKQELEDLLKTFPEWQDDDSLALTAAAINLSAVNIEEEMPAHLKNRILADADTFFVKNEESKGKVLEFEPRAKRDSDVSEEIGEGIFGKLLKTNWLGWAVAAAACLALAFSLLFPRTSSPIVQNPPPQVTPTPTPGLGQQREELLASAKDILARPWGDLDPKKPKNIQGEVVWSNSTQKGYVRFKNLPVNDKTKETYQLWVFDANQNAKTPIDGGVFDVDKEGDVIVPINAKIKVEKPVMFAVTAEKPGGVVVSELGKVMAVAKV